MADGVCQVVGVGGLAGVLPQRHGVGAGVHESGRHAALGTAGTEYVGLHAALLLEIFLASPAARLIVNNSSPDAFAIDRQEARTLLEVAATMPADGAVALLTGPPAGSERLADVLRRACADHAEVREGYLYCEQRFDEPLPPEGIDEDARDWNRVPGGKEDGPGGRRVAATGQGMRSVRSRQRSEHGVATRPTAGSQVGLPPTSLPFSMAARCDVTGPGSGVSKKATTGIEPVFTALQAAA